VLLVKLIEPPCTERYARWCERSGNHSDFPPTRSFSYVKEEAVKLFKRDWQITKNKVLFKGTSYCNAL